MFKHILLPTDGTPASEAAVDACIRFARETGASITALHSVPALHLFTYEPLVTEEAHQKLKKTQEMEAKQYLESIEQRANAAGVPCKTALVTADQPFEAIIETARTAQCDLIVMASHGRRGLKALLLGSETQKVLTHSAVPVLVYR